MKITFVLPGHGTRPVGGFKVVYQYANELARRGHVVTVVHTPYQERGDHSPRLALRRLLIYAARSIGVDGGYRPDSWFMVDPRVRLRWLPGPDPRRIPDGEVVVATSWHTAEWVRCFPAQKGRKLYLIHDYEHYMTANESIRSRMAATYRAGMHNIVTSPAGVEMLEQCRASVDECIPNGLDLDVYELRNPIEDGDRTSIGFPARHEVFKGTSDAIAALEIVRSTVGSDMRVWAFGSRSESLPDWVEFHRRPSDQELADLHNNSRIFVQPSHYEGWGLPGAEAMACGTALATTDSVGVRVYAEHEKTALLSPPKDTEALAENILRLMRDEGLRTSLASEGHRRAQQFTWSRAVDAFEACISEARG